MLHNERRSSLRRVLMLLLAAVLVVTLAAACGKDNDKDEKPASDDKSAVVATYDGGQVTEKEFNRYIGLLGLNNPQTAMYMSIPQFKEQELKKYIMYNVMYDRSAKEDKEAGEKEGAAFAEQLKTAVEKQPDLKEKLTSSGLTAEEAQAMVTRIVTSSKVIQKKMTEFAGEVKDEEIKAKFAKNPNEFDTATVRHILIVTKDPQTGEAKRKPEEALKIAKEVKTKLESGGDWGTLAKKYSEDETSKDKGGLYENAEVSQWVAGFKDAALKQEIGKIGEPVETEFGYHVIKVEKRDSMTYEKLSQANKDKLKEGLASEKLNAYMEAEQKKINVKVTLPKEPAAGTEGGTDNGTAGENKPAEESGAKDDAAKEAK